MQHCSWLTCAFPPDGSVEELLLDYETHRKRFGNGRRPHRPRSHSVLERRDRTELSLAKKLGSADFAITSQITRAAWYAAFSVKRV